MQLKLNSFKNAIQNIAEAMRNLIGNKTADKLVSKSSPQNNYESQTEIPK